MYISSSWLNDGSSSTEHYKIISNYDIVALELVSAFQGTNMYVCAGIW